jgi:hypothetical protein
MSRPTSQDATSQEPEIQVTQLHEHRDGWFASWNVGGAPFVTGPVKPTPIQAIEALEERVKDIDDTLQDKKPLVNEKTTSMKPKAFKELLDKEETPNGQVVGCIKAKLTSLYEEKTGEKDGRHWQLQNGEFTDDAGTKMRVCFSNCTQPVSAKGKVLIIKSVQSQQHGLQGVKVEDDSYEKNNKQVEVRQLRITSTADITYEGGAPQSAPSSGQGSPASSGPGLAKSNANVKQSVTDMLDCQTTLYSLVNERLKGVDGISEVAKVSMTNTLFIECAKAGLISDFSKRYAAVTYPPAPKDPKQWKECVIPSGEFAGKTLVDVPDDKLLKFFEYYETHSDPKVQNGAFAECVYQAARDRDILPKPAKQEPEQDLTQQEAWGEEPVDAPPF